MRQIVKRLIERYLEGQTAPAEEQSITDWLDTLAATEPYPGKTLSDKDKEHLRRQLLQAIRRKTGQQQKVRRMIWRRTGVAAAVVGLVSVGALLIRFLTAPQPPAYASLQTGLGEKKVMTLPDSTRIYLAPNSELLYPESYPQSRHIQLLRGEAFFEVTKNATQPFTVAVDSLQIEVLGTSFDVQAYQQLPDWRIAVNTGKVRVSRQQQVLGLLETGRQMHISRQDNAVTLSPANNNALEGWVKNRMVFEQTPLPEVLALLQEYYPVTFTQQYKGDLLISGSLDTKMRVEQIIAVLEELGNHDIQFHKKANNRYEVTNNH
ncbi:DUF4974 domain-containing protein [Chitinophaga agrisoli]|uniref:DUF4974 domain-containing protein n=1 Tax=Chitinophaga agrisoli TaxID=2607653 RepID=A0A5B2VNG7_9BACT|nr:FecR domain-containing protein [Chitinophaga agrisoli]KAA2239946.1 DUF4974 domain-containing protein [Chitinophaga agrisoli]